MQDPSNTVLVIYPPSVDPRPFLTRLVQLPNPVEEGEDSIEWTIDNKYYTARVLFQLQELGQHGVIRADGVDVVLYIFQRTPTSLPAGLIKILNDQPRDIALAIRVAREAQDGEEDTDGEVDVDLFGEVGLEVIDETARPEEDDERPISPLDDIRQTLMTHLWPGMVRKTAQRQADLAPADSGSDDETSSIDDERDGGAAAGPSFPISFDPSAPIPPEHPTGADHAKEGFPGLQELQTQLELDDMDRLDRLTALDRLDRLDGAFEDGDYARLDEWLDGDDEDGSGEFVQLDEGEEEDHHQLQGDEAEGVDPTPQIPTLVAPSHEPEGPADGAERPPPDGFEDDFEDFADFAAFQSAPPASEPTLSLDPTPLLLHLQSVREELAGLDEDERRLRAGREVARVMRDLGMGDGIDLDDFDDLAGEDGLDEIDGLNGLGNIGSQRR